MALIENFQEVRIDRQTVHEPVRCGWRVFTVNGETILQLDTYGSADRKVLGKVSQSIQLNRQAARDLLGILERAFPRL